MEERGKTQSKNSKLCGLHPILSQFSCHTSVGGCKLVVIQQSFGNNVFHSAARNLYHVLSCPLFSDLLNNNHMPASPLSFNEPDKRERGSMIAHSPSRPHISTALEHRPLWIVSFCMFCSSKPTRAHACLHPLEPLVRRINIKRQRRGAASASDLVFPSQRR